MIVIFWPLFPIRSRSDHALENMILILMKITKCDLDRDLSITRSLTLMHWLTLRVFHLVEAIFTQRCKIYPSNGKKK